MVGDYYVDEKMVISLGWDEMISYTEDNIIILYMISKCLDALHGSSLARVLGWYMLAEVDTLSNPIKFGLWKGPDTRSKCVVTMNPTQAGQSGVVGTRSAPPGLTEDIRSSQKDPFCLFSRAGWFHMG